MEELLIFLRDTYEKSARTQQDKKEIYMEVSRNDLQIMIESIVRMGEVQVFQKEIERIKEQHAEEIAKITKEASHDKGMRELLHDELQITKCEFKGYRQAVKDILGEGN